MKLYLPVIFLFFFSLFQAASQTPDWVWARSASNTVLNAGTAEGVSIAVDPSEDVYITGWYFYTVNFGPDTLTCALNTYNPYLAKYDASGNVLWAKSAANTGTASAFGQAVCTDLFGNCYLTGYFTGTITFGSYTLTGTGFYDVFLVKYDSSGNVLWAKSAVGNYQEFPYSVACDRWGNVFVTGQLGSSTMTFGSHTITNNNGVWNDLFLAKYDSAGNVIWAKSGTGTGGAGGDTGYGVATDASGDVYVVGQFGGSFYFGPDTLTAVSSDIFLTKYDSSGNEVWGRRAGGAAEDAGASVATDTFGNIYITGNFRSPYLYVGFDTLINAGNSGRDAFLAKYNFSGNEIWAKDIGGTGDEWGSCVATDKSGKVYLTGGAFPQFSPSLTFDTITLLPPSGSIDPMFIAGYNSAGHAFFAKALPRGGDDWNAVATSSPGCVYIGGDYLRGTDPYIIGNDTLSPTFTEDVFVAKLCYTIPTADFTSSDTAFCDEGGKCIDFFDHSTGNPTSWHWLFTGANPSSSTQQNPTNICYTNPGTYPVTLIVSNGTLTDTLDVSPLIIYGIAPLPPTITVIGGDTLVSSHGSSYQWYFNGTPIAGATDSFYVAHQAGTYAIQITDVTGGCNSISNGVTLGVISLTDESGISFFPNPFHDKLTVVMKGNEQCEITLFDITSRELLHQRFKNSVSLNTEPLVQGVYLYEVRNKSGVIGNGLVVKD